MFYEHGKQIWIDRKIFMGTKSAEKPSEIFIRRLTKTSRNCRLPRMGSVISREFSNGNFHLQVADVLEGM